jgi:hypothetical protein
MPLTAAHGAAIIGLVVTLLCGLGVGRLVRYVSASFTLTPPSEPLRGQWALLTSMNTAGKAVGHIERPIFFVAAFLQAWVLLAAWLVMKTAIYWQSTNFAKFPDQAPTAADVDYLVAKRCLGAHHLATLLVGTGANILCALLGTAVAKWIVP